MSIQITDALLHAYADNRLDAAQTREVETFLANNPGRAVDVAIWRRQNETIAALFPPIVEPVPERLRPQRLARRMPDRMTQFIRYAAAAMVMLSVGGTIGWVGRDYLKPETAPYERLISSAMFAHALYSAETRHAVEVGGDEKDHLIKWLSGRVNRSFDAPQLAGKGFNLVGGRLLPPDTASGSGAAAQLMYENAAAHRVTVYITAALPSGGPDYQLVNNDGLEAFYWANDAITCTVVGDLPKVQMDAVAQDVYKQLTWTPDGFIKGYLGIFGIGSQKT